MKDSLSRVLVNFRSIDAMTERIMRNSRRDCDWTKWDRSLLVTPGSTDALTSAAPEAFAR